MPRFLTVLDINDKHNEFEYSQYNVDVFELRTWESVQENLINNPNCNADLVLLDVSFDKDPTLEKANLSEWGARNVVPAGPLLALPFISGRSTVVMVPYSAVFDACKLDPSFLVAVGIIAAKTEQEVHLSDVLGNSFGCKRVEDFVDRLIDTAKGNPSDSLKIALEKYRDALKINDAREIISIRNAFEVSERLNSIKFDALDKSFSSVELPVEIGLEWVNITGGQDNVSLVSIWADKVHLPSNLVEFDTLDEIINWLNNFIDGKTPFDYAITVISKREEDDRRIDHLIADICKSKDTNFKHEVFRLSILLCNVLAWISCGDKPFSNQRVYSTVGTENKTYEKFFGLQKSGKSSGTTTSINVPPLSPFMLKAGGSSVFLVEGSLLTKQDDMYVRAFISELSKREDIVWNCPYEVL